jgi:hypothetical protein
MAKAKKVHDWSEIPQETFTAFNEAVEKLRDEMIPRDAEGDSPIQILVVNRMTHQGINFAPVPRHEVYSYITHNYLDMHPDKAEELEDETEIALSFNIHMAADALDQHMRMKQHRNYTTREAGKPIEERIKARCKFCAKGVKFNPNHSGDFYENIRAKYPDYPYPYHTGGDDKCGAFDLHRLVFNLKHPEFAGKPEEPRYCVNPDCRCKLPGYNSKKGAKDKWVCVNNRCRWDNTKYYQEVENAVPTTTNPASGS